MYTVQKPIQRSVLRRQMGKEYYILKRKWSWYFGHTKWAKQNRAVSFNNTVFKHKSLLMRPLKNVDMYLQENKKTNLALAIEKTDKTVIKPGETFSVWRAVGRPTKRKGYLEGLVLNQGAIETGIGGGLCQLGNLLFWIFAHSPLEVYERHRHSFDVFPDVNRKIPFGAGATLAYNYIDLQIKNNTSNTFQINLWLDKVYLNGELTALYPVDESYMVEERNHMIQHQFWGGYTRHNQIFKIIVDKKQHKKREELLVENHAIMMYNPFIEGDTKQ